MVCDDLPVNEVETPQTVEALQLELMVMSGPCFPEVDLTSSQEIVETLKVPHHSLRCIEDQPNNHISLPPLELHDPITHTLEESYTASTHAQHEWSTFLTFACMTQSRECIHSTSSHSVTQYHRSSTECMSCTLTHLCSVVACKIGVCLLLWHLSCFLVRTTVLFTNHAFTNMGQPIHRWMHWKYHLMWDDPCTVSLGVGVVFTFELFSCMLFFLLDLFVCLSAFLFAYFLFFHFRFSLALLCCLLVRLFHS